LVAGAERSRKGDAIERAGSVAPSLSRKANIAAVTMLPLPLLMVAILVFCAFTAGDLPSRR